MSTLSNIHCIPSFTDNYIWLLQHQNLACVVDPGDAQPVLDYLTSKNLTLHSILITHWHPDHIGGVEALLKKYPDIEILAPESPHIKCCTQRISGEMQFKIFNYMFNVIAVPGHTLDHVAFHESQHKLLFAGDTLFAGGCGRVFEGTNEQMFSSLKKLAKLDENTLVYCAHEYTQANLKFCLAAENSNIALQLRINKVNALRAAGLPSVPSLLHDEIETNVFLRTGVNISRNIPQPFNQALTSSSSDVEIFSALREWKNNF